MTTRKPLVGQSLRFKKDTYTIVQELPTTAGVIHHLLIKSHDGELFAYQESFSERTRRILSLSSGAREYSREHGNVWD